MIEFDSQIEDRHAYPLMPEEHRWIFNKLLLAEKLGYDCGPCGMPAKGIKDYCVRPIMNFAGRGEGGVIRHSMFSSAPMPYIPGWFWCEWFEGWHGWTNFTDDKPIYESGGMETDGVLNIRYDPVITFKELPECLRGISKHMLVEHIGGKIIEVSPRHAERVFPPKLVKDDEGQWYVPS